MQNIKSSLKNKDGAALPLVLLMTLILTMFGTVLYMLAWNSYITVSRMNAQKQSYFFSRAAVEFAAYAYQMTNMEATSERDTGASNLITFSDSEGSILKTNTIYVIPDENSGTGKWKGLTFSVTPTETAIGEFYVEIGNGIDYTDVTDENNVTTKTPTKVKAFRACAKSYREKPTLDESGNIANADSIDSAVQYLNAYISTSEQSSPLSFYDENGVLSTDSYTSGALEAGNVSTDDKKDKFLKISKTVDINGTNVQPSSNKRFFIFRFLETLRKSLIKAIFEHFYGSSVTVDLYIKNADGNLVLSKPEKSTMIKTRDKVHNYYIFATPEDLFINSGLNVVPTKGNYNSVGLYGDEIVIDGDIIMGVYYIKPSKINSEFISGIEKKVNSLVNTVGNRYRMGTVMLGEGSNGLTTRIDPVPVKNGGLMCEGVTVPANKVYFNGNVYVKIFNQGGATETYRVFNAGDMAYFYGGYSEDGTIDGENVTAKGIDLLKYFLDAVIDGKGGFNYGNALVEKAKLINELYYTGSVSDAAYTANNVNYTETRPESEYQFREGDPTPYFNDKTVLVRKIQVKYAANGEVTVDGGFGSVLDLIQPSNIGPTNIKWGDPEGGTVFNPKEGNKY